MEYWIQIGLFFAVCITEVILNEVYIVNSVCQSNHLDGAMGKIVIASELFAYKFKE
jgi:hypothetical protein